VCDRYSVSFTPGELQRLRERGHEGVVLAPAVPVERPREGVATLAQVRQLMQLDLAPPADDADRAKLASALDEPIAWATAPRGRLEPGPAR
jgi:hypothetical protein